MNGKGTYDFSDGVRDEGHWKDNKLHGHAISYLADGARYEGRWKDGNYHGEGIWKAADGTYVEGQWKEGKMHGRMFFCYIREKVTALFEHGEFVSSEVIKSMSREDLTVEILKLKEKFNQLKQPNIQDDSEIN